MRTISSHTTHAISSCHASTVRSSYTCTGHTICSSSTRSTSTNSIDTSQAITTCRSGSSGSSSSTNAINTIHTLHGHFTVSIHASETRITRHTGLTSRSGCTNTRSTGSTSSTDTTNTIRTSHSNAIDIRPVHLTILRNRRLTIHIGCCPNSTNIRRHILLIGRRIHVTVTSSRSGSTCCTISTTRKLRRITSRCFLTRMYITTTIAAHNLRIVFTDCLCLTKRITCNRRFRCITKCSHFLRRSIVRCSTQSCYIFTSMRCSTIHSCLILTRSLSQRIKGHHVLTSLTKLSITLCGTLQ